MQGKTVTIDFGHLFLEKAEGSDLVQQIEHLLNVNVEEMIRNWAYRAKMSDDQKPHKLKVVVSLEEA